MVLHDPIQLTQDCASCPIHNRAVCSLCDADDLARLAQAKHYRRIQAGQTLVWAGERTDFVASIVSGIATVSRTLEDGRRQMLGLLLPSDFIGRPGRSIATYDVTAKTDILLCCFRRAPFEQLLISTPPLGKRLLEMTLDELDVARQWMLLLGRKTAREKIAHCLDVLAHRMGALSDQRHNSLGFELPLTRDEMADYLGLTLETVSRQLSALRRDGIIQLDGTRHVTIPDILRLRAETGDERYLA